MCKKLYVVDPTSRLYTLDPATATPQEVGAVGIASVTDIAFHGPTLYGISFSQFLRIDPRTGAGQAVGNTGFSTNGLAVAPDGTIYAAGGDDLITIDPTTGVGSQVGNFGGGLTSSGDLAFDSNGALFGALQSAGGVVLASIDRDTGVATTIGNTGLNTLYGLAFFCCRLYGATSGGELVEVNVASGKAHVIGKNTLTQWGMDADLCGC